MATRARYVLVFLLLLTGVMSCTAILGINTDYDENKCNADTELDPLRCGKGACLQLVPACDEQGLPGTCPAPKTDADEICNNLDDNCNGEIDEGCACEVSTVKSCFSGSPLTRNVGLCRDGQHECKNGSWAECIGDILPVKEICDQFDNDCDGEVDEDCECAPGAVQPCYGGAQVTLGIGACALGTQNCEDGYWGDCKGDVLPGVEATPDACNGVDDDCDGTVDENPPCTCTQGQTQECYGGNPDLAGIGECKIGTQQCIKGAWGPCENYGVPGTEICNALDDDCNGEPDDGDLGVGGPCNVPGVQGPCKNGQYVCSTLGLECQQIVFPVAELCNGTDDDCNGIPDNGNPEGGAPCFVSGNPQPLGECAKGEVVCQGGSLVCKQVNLPTGEECDGEDDDCNGVIDNGNLCCPDNVQNGTETDVDCGGPCMKKCVPGQKCVQDFDCASLSCKNGFCQNPTCNDITKNGNESDVDCGGPCPIKCSIGQSCNVPSDCVFNVCAQNVCLNAGCMDVVKNGNESDVDCGGGVCPKCDNFKTCTLDQDCKSLVCKLGICQAPTCSDSAKNGTETDTNCGGGTCPKCNNNQGCLVGADCLSNVCTGQFCQTPSCADLVKNGNESDVDCGGQCPQKCDVGEICVADGDCASNVCQNGFCAKKLKGTPCITGSECGTNNCVDGVCCDTACSGLCQACTNALKGSGADGDCNSIAAGADPANECAQDTVGSCGQTGFCNGAGLCAQYPFGTTCAAASCGADGVTLTLAQTCNGSGSCVTQMPATNNCAPGICENNICKTICTSGMCAPNAYCNNGTCLAKKVDGQACDPSKTGLDCLNGNCVDGVCCNVPCGNPCEACTANKTGGITGICANIPTGSDPDNECAFTPASTCSTTGVCSGFASCQLYTANTECVAANCATPTSVNNPDVCNGSGSCVDKGVTLCGGFACSAGACTNLKVLGAACVAGSECGSGFCADGNCCNTSCGGSCDVCAAALGASADGTCTNVTGAGDPTCAPYVCKGASAACPGICSTDIDCIAGYYCGSGACQQKQVNGQTCSTPNQCQSGLCVDSVCCNDACVGSCNACSVTSGAPVNGTCSNITGAGNPSCAPYTCSGGQATCPNICLDDSGCASTHYCAGGTCTVRLISGQGCAAGNQCQSSNCVDGVCCNTACAGACDACAAALGAPADGTCGTVMGPGTPTCAPYVCTGSSAVCPLSCSSDNGCVNTHYCNGSSCSAKLTDGQSCGTANQCQSGNCVDGVCCNSSCAGSCNACSTTAGAPSNGTCANVTGTGNPSCGAYVCSGASATCPIGCTDDNGCSAGNYCNAGNLCVPKVITGQVCIAANQCLSGFCADGRCCDSACSGECNACSMAAGAPSNGTCANVTGAGNPSCGTYVCSGASATCPIGCTDDNGCSAGNYCNAGNLCVPKVITGQTCTATNQCLSGFCADGRCCDSACSGECNACSMAAGAPSDGTCTNITGGGSPSCGAYLCSGMAATCPVTCGVDTDCAAGNYCNAGACVLQLADGQACSGGNQCQSGSCADSVCCNSACTGACNACSIATGALSNGTCTNITGGGNPSCGAYLCDGMAATCPATCGVDADCAAGNYCNAGACVLLLSSGQTCTGDNQCQTGSCADSVCCNSACTGACNACSIATGAPSNGTCANITGGGNPSCGAYLCDGMASTCPATCGVDADCAAGNYCDAGACVLQFADGQACGAPNQCQTGNCEDGVCCASDCDCGTCAPGTGVCSVATLGDTGTPSCTPFVCDGASGACPLACDADTDCVADHFCSGVGGGNGVCTQRSLLALTGGTSAIHGGVFTAGGAWVVSPITGAALPTGSDVALAVDGTGRGVGLVRDSNVAANLRSTVWNGSWSTFASITGDPIIVLSPAIDATLESGSLVAAYQRTNSTADYFRSFTSAWSAEESISTATSPDLSPDIAVLPNGDAVLLFASGKDTMATTRVSGIWQPAVTVDSVTGGNNPSIAPTIAALIGSGSELVAINVRTGGQIRASVRTGGTWSATAQIGSSTTTARVAVAALPGGGAVVGYVATGNILEVSFLTDAASNMWSTPAAVAGVSTTKTPGLARGIGTGVNSAVVELAYIDGSSKVFHRRCTSVTAGACDTWTAAAPIDNAGSTLTATSVALAPTP